MFGPFPGPTHDKRMVRESFILNRCALYAKVGGILYYLFGDKGYDRHPCLQCAILGALPDSKEDKFNKRMSKLRVSVEWSFGKVSKLFAFVDFEKNQRLYMQPVAAYWQVAVLLTNCHSCLYGNQTSMYFQVPTPRLETYLARGF